jgi:hypothetical protein
MRKIPSDLRSGPFTRREAEAAGVTAQMLRGRRFVRVFPRVWRARETELTERDWLAAARLTLPPNAQPTGITRIQHLGLDYGPRRPMRFVVEGPLHLTPPEIFLHRTRRLPPLDDFGVTPAAAFVSYCSLARVLDAIKVGDWLLHHGHTTKEEVSDLCLSQPWRAGAREAAWILQHLVTGCRSVKESETRAVLTFAGLPRPEINVAIDVGEDVLVIGDLAYPRWRTVVEYEGRHHQTDRSQYQSDLDRYALMRAADISYVQATHEKLDRARTLVGEVFRTLVSNGYEGPAPVFGEEWQSLFVLVRRVVGTAPPGRSAVS